jgi:hypothetical protein
LRRPEGDEAERLHGHLLELFGRAADGVPHCKAAEFADPADRGHGCCRDMVARVVRGPRT